MSDLRPTWPCVGELRNGTRCGGVAKLAGRYKRNPDFGVYRCERCGRETIETAQPLPTDRTGADMQTRERAGGAGDGT